MYEFNDDTLFLVKGKTMSALDIKQKYGISDEESDDMLNRLVKANKIQIKEEVMAEKDDIKDFLKSHSVQEKAQDVINQESKAKQAKREQKIAERDLIDVELSFRTTVDASKAQVWINSLGIEDTEIALKKDMVLLRVRQITIDEYATIAKRYNTENVIRNGVELTDKAIQSLVSGINYTATNVVAPVGAIVGKAGMNLGKGLIHTTAKVGAQVVNSGAETIAETKIALANDTEMIKAKATLQEAKNNLFGFVSKKLGSKGTKGINIIN